MMHLQRSIKLSKLPCQIVLRDNICLFLPRERQWPASLLLSDYLLTFSFLRHTSSTQHTHTQKLLDFLMNKCCQRKARHGTKSGWRPDPLL